MANNMIEIPGRLHSVAVEGQVAGANEIFDDSLGKNQQTINQKFSEAIGEGGTVDEKIASAKAEIEGEINTLSEEVAYLGDGAGSADIPGFDPETDTVHVKAQVLSEAQKAQVRTNIGLNDVDAKIAVEASARQAGDQVAINTVNSAISAQDRKMANMQATINAKQLEIGAVQTDDEPTKNSGNHVTSGTIYDYTAKRSDVYVLASDYSVINRKKIGQNGLLADDAVYTVFKFSCERNDVFKIVYPGAFGGTASLLYSIFSSETELSAETLVEMGSTMVGKSTPDYITVPEAGQTILICARVNSVNNTIYRNNYPSSLLPEVIEKSRYIGTCDLEISPLSVIDGYKMQVDGSLYSLPNQSTLAFYPCSGGDKFHIKSAGLGPTGAMLCGFYSSTSAFNESTIVGFGPEINPANDMIITAPDGAVGILFTTFFVRINPQIFKVGGYLEGVKSKKEGAMYMKFTNNNNVNVNYKYSEEKDIQVNLAPLGINNIVQLYRWGFIPNSSINVSPDTPSEFVLAGSDTICPYVLNCTDADTGATAQGWTGGNHGTINAGGNPTGRTTDVSVYADNRKVQNNTECFADEVRVVVTNEIMANNTVENTETGTPAIYCIEEKVTYLFKDGKIYVSVMTKALHAIQILTYYGMGVNQFTSEIIYFGENVQVNDFSTVSVFTERCNGFACKNADGEYIIAHLNPVGLAKRTPEFYAHAYNYGKAYFNFKKETEEPIVLAIGNYVYWSGYLQFSNKLDIISI